MTDLYGTDIFSYDPHRDGAWAKQPRSRHVAAEIGMVLEDVETGFVGAITHIEKSGGMVVMDLEDRHGQVRGFPVGPGFWIDGEPVIVDPPRASSPQLTSGGRVITNSGSLKADHGPGPRHTVGRLWVEGKHDSELISHVWGDDLREAGVDIMVLDGVDKLEESLALFGPSGQSRAGVLVDHLVAGSKESRIAEQMMGQWEGSVLVLGHPFVDVWQAVKPARVGLERWPDIPRGTDIKHGTLAALGWPHDTPADIARGWRRILSQVRDFRDIEPALWGCVEHLIDFVTEPFVPKE